MQYVDAAAAHSGPAQDVLSILNAAQEATEVQLPSDSRSLMLPELQHMLRYLHAVLLAGRNSHVHASLKLSSQCTVA